MSHVIEVSGVSKNFGSLSALQAVDLTVPRGAIFGLLGENGAGKSTLIRALMGFESVDSGRIRVLGEDPQRDPVGLRRRVGYISDAPAMYDWMTVDQIGWFASGFYSDGYLKNFQRAVSNFGLPLRTRIKHLSKGMRAKTALALVVAAEPELMILDEPTSGLDPTVRRSFLESMIDRAAEGQTVFLSSHQVAEVERVANWIGILHRGRLVLIGELEAVKQVNQQVAIALSNPMISLDDHIDLSTCQYARRDGRQWQLLMRDWREERRGELESLPGLLSLEVTRPSLEDLFVAYTQPSPELEPRAPSPRSASPLPR